MKKIDEKLEDTKVEKGVGPISATDVDTKVESKEETLKDTSVAVIALTNLKYKDMIIKIGQEFDVEESEVEEFANIGVVELK